MNTFGSWITQLRSDSGLDLRAVAYESDIHFTTIGRIEKGVNEPTLDTAVKITMALNGQPADLYKHITGLTPLIPSKSHKFHPFFPTLNDQINFEDSILCRPKAISEHFAYLLNVITNNPCSEISYLDRILEVHYPDPESHEIKWLLDSVTPNFYTGLDIIKFLISYPPGIKGERISIPALQYPYSMENKTILKAYKQNGIMILADLKAYIHNIFDKKAVKSFETNNVSDKTITKVEMIKDKIFVDGQFRNLKLGDFFTIDKILADQGEIFMIAWSAANEEIRQSRNLRAQRVGYLLVSISRFLAAYQNPEPDWLIELRNIFNNKDELNPVRRREEMRELIRKSLFQ